MKLKFYQNLLGRKFMLTLTAGVVLITQAYSQTPQQVHKCGNDIHTLAQQYPDFMKAYHEFEATWEDYKQNVNLRDLERTASGKYIIPVVFHVLHLGGTENISASQCKSNITAMNLLFGMDAPNLSTISSFPAFDTLVPYFNGADTCYVSGPGSQLLNRFEFRLATIDPLGNCTDGINRVYTEKCEDAVTSNETRFKQISNWDRSKYFNIWSVSTIESNGGNTTLGYAQFPFPNGGQLPLASTDGVALIHQRVGTTGTASGGNAATAVHEAGHWLGLRHIWGDEDCGSDGVDDTPIHFEPNYSGPGCFSLPKAATCYTDTNSTDTAINQMNLLMRYQIGEMWMNFMDYTDDNCMSMFSEEQYRKMNFTMETVSFRGTLSDAANVLATGTDDAAQASPCNAKPIADLWSRDGSNNFIIQKLVCAGGDLTYRDGTYNLSNPGSDPATRSWEFPGGTPATSTLSSPVVVYDTPGVYDATLTSTNADGSNTKTRDNYVIVSSNTADESNYVYYDDFEYSTSLYEQGKWININQGTDPANGWEQTTSVGYLSAKSMVMRNSNNILFEQDFLVSPSYDMTTMTGEKLYFKYSGARKTAQPFITQKDEFRVYVSTNCGETWTVRPIKIDGVSRSVISGDTLYPAGLVPDNFVPTAANQWNEGEVDLSIAPYNVASNLRVMFVWTSGGPYGNDFYIDQVNISNSTAIGIEDNTELTNYSVYPNPVTATSQIYFSLLSDSKVNVDVVDITGRVVQQIFSGDLPSGDQFFDINNADFGSAGIYMVRLTVNGVVATKKIIVE